MIESLLFIDLRTDSTVVRPVIEFSYSAIGRFLFLCAGIMANKLSPNCYLTVLSFAIDIILSSVIG